MTFRPCVGGGLSQVHYLDIYTAQRNTVEANANKWIPPFYGAKALLKTKAWSPGAAQAADTAYAHILTSAGRFALPDITDLPHPPPVITNAAGGGGGEGVDNVRVTMFHKANELSSTVRLNCCKPSSWRWLKGWCDKRSI